MTRPSVSLNLDHKRLLDWYDTNRRDLPWRQVSGLYEVWVSEVMLQQTTVAAVVPFYRRWMERFPTVESLARASEDEALSVWAGLGYYSRCKRFLAGAKWVVENGWPKSTEEWLKVPGVGPYTAAAVCSIAQGFPAAVVDGNVERVYARFNADSAPRPSLKRSASVWASEVLESNRPGDWNQALMELGATVCRPRKPECLRCPLSVHCAGRRTGSPEAFPTAVPRLPQVEVFDQIWVPVCGEDFGICRTPAGEWWSGLWGFPRAQTTSELLLFVPSGQIHPAGKFVHTVTKHRIEVKVSVVQCTDLHPALNWVKPDELATYALPAPQKRAFQLSLAQLRILGRNPA